jgi:uncharacterized protein YndB with AHSA1/START domain
MPVKKDPSGRRSVEVETEVPGTPEEVWRAIATGPGITSWFVPARIEEREGGAIILDFGPGMESHSVVKVWEPPHRFVAETENSRGPGSPTVADEWTIEAKAGGTCRVRVVHSWFASTDDWDNQFEDVENGWPAFFRILKIYLGHFSGQPSELVQLLAMSTDNKAATWQKFLGALGLTQPAQGQRLSSEAPILAGVIERVGDAELLLRLEKPTTGVGNFMAIGMGGQAFLSLSLYLYGAEAKAAAAREGHVWQEWVDGLFPPADAQAQSEASQP